MKTTVAVINPIKGSIYSRLREKLGREPTAAELRAEVARIIASARP